MRCGALGKGGEVGRRDRHRTAPLACSPGINHPQLKTCEGGEDSLMATCFAGGSSLLNSLVTKRSENVACSWRSRGILSTGSWLRITSPFSFIHSRFLSLHPPPPLAMIILWFICPACLRKWCLVLSNLKYFMDSSVRVKMLVYLNKVSFFLKHDKIIADKNLPNLIINNVIQ